MSEFVELQAPPVVRPASRLYRAGAVALGPLGRLYRLEVDGREHLPSGGFVLCANQLSNVDTVALPLAVLPRPLRAMGKAELWRTPIGPLLTALGGFPVERGRADREAILKAVEAVRGGDGLLVFPEGTRRAKGKRHGRAAERPTQDGAVEPPAPHEGAALIALLAGVPVVPAAIGGTDALTRFRAWRIRFGEPIEIERFAVLPRREGRRALTAELWARITSLEASLDANGGR